LSDAELRVVVVPESLKQAASGAVVGPVWLATAWSLGLIMTFAFPTIRQGRRKAMVKVIGCLKRKAGMTSEEFHRYWLC